MTIGDKIRELRRKQNITQEKLAEYLNITFQSVSKWETGTAIPDISMLVPLANFFGVTTDELLGTDEAKQKAEIDAFYSEAQRVGYHKYIDECRVMAKKYPRVYGVQTALASGLVVKYWNDVDPPNNRENGNLDELREAEEIFNRVLTDSIDLNERGLALQYLAYIYNDSDTPLYDPHKIIQLAKFTASAFSTTSDDLITSAYAKLVSREKDEAKKEEYQSKFNEAAAVRVKSCLQKLIQSLSLPGDQVESIKTAIKLYDVLFDGDYLFYNFDISNKYRDLALWYARRSERNNVVDALRKAFHYAKQFDELPEHVTHTSKFMFGTDGGKYGELVRDSYVVKLREWRRLVDAYVDKPFEFLRGDVEFEALFSE